MSDEKVHVDSLNCPKCGASLDMKESTISLKCKYCGNALVITFPLKDNTSNPGISQDDIDKLFNE